MVHPKTTQRPELPKYPTSHPKVPFATVVTAHGQRLAATATVPIDEKVVGGRVTDAGRHFVLGKSREDLSLRSAVRQVYANPDGTFTAFAHAGPVFTRDSNGWRQINTSLVRTPSGRLAPVATSASETLAPGTAESNKKASSSTTGAAESASNPGRTVLAASVSGPAASTSAQQELVNLKIDDQHSVGFSVAGAGAVSGQVKGSSVDYAGALPQVDVKLTSEATGVKESLVLHSATAPTVYDFPLDLQGLTPSIDQTTGQVVFTDASGHVATYIPHGSMTDAKINPLSGVSRCRRP